MWQLCVQTDIPWRSVGTGDKNCGDGEEQTALGGAQVCSGFTHDTTECNGRCTEYTQHKKRQRLFQKCYSQKTEPFNPLPINSLDKPVYRAAKYCMDWNLKWNLNKYTTLVASTGGRMQDIKSDQQNTRPQ
jgi:hypothetical protein